MAVKTTTPKKAKTRAVSSTPKKVVGKYREKFPTADPPTQYALDVVSGKELAGPLVRLACQRHLNDLEEGRSRGLRWEWTLADGSAPRGTGKYVADFFASELLLQVDDRVEPFLLAPPLLFIIGSLYGWKGPDGYRRFRIAYVEIGKGNAKTTLGGGMLLYMGIADGEINADCYTAAVDKDQAKIPFKDAVNFVNRNPRLDGVLKRSGGEGQEWNLAYLKTGSFMRPISSDTKGRGKSGFRPHFVLLDELHEHPTSAMVDLAEANLKTRRQPLVFKITNSGVVDPGTVCYQTHEHGQGMLEGNPNFPNDDSRFFYICGLDKGDSYLDPAIRKKANPMYGVIPRMERYLDDAVATAQGMPSKISIVRRLNFCEWVESADPWITKEVWDRNNGQVNADALAGWPCYAGLDLSKRDDLTALVLCFPDGEFVDVLVFAWTPAEGIADREHRDKTPYSQWIEEKVLLTTPGKTIDYDFVAAKIGELTGTYDFQAIAFDHWHFPEMERALNAAGVTVNVIDHPQGHQGMNPSIEAAEQDLINGLVRHGGNALLTACVFNVRVDKNAQALRMFDKRDSTKRIDAAQSFVMAEGILHGAELGATYEVTVI